MNEEWYTMEEAMQRLQRTKNGVYYHVFKGHIRKNDEKTSRVRYSKADIEALVKKKIEEELNYQDRMSLKALIEIFRILKTK